MSLKRSHLRETLALAAPVALSQVSDMLTVMADTVMVGHVGTVPLAAATLANTVWILGFLFPLGFTIAITPLAGAAWGERNLPAMARAVRGGARLSLLVGAVATVVLAALAPLLDRFGAPAEVASAATGYYLWIVASILPRMAFGVFKQTAEAMANTRSAMVVALVANAVNVLLNWVFIWGHWGAPAMGVAGAGLATFLSRVLMLAMMWLIWNRTSTFARLRVALRSPAVRQLDRASDRHDMRVAFRTGLPIAGQIVLEVSAFAVGAMMIGWLGAVPLAAHQVAMNLAALTFMVALGISAAATIRVSNALGAGDGRFVRDAGTAALALVLAWNAITAAMFFTLRFWLPTNYTNDPAVIALAAELLLFAAIFQIFDGSQNVGLGLLRGLNDVRIPTLMAIASYTCINIPVSYLCAFPLEMGARGVWLGFIAGLAVASILYVLRFRTVSRRLGTAVGG